MKYLLLVTLLSVFTSDNLAAQTIDNRVRIKKKSSLKMNDGISNEFNEEKQALLSKKRTGLIADIKRFIREAKSQDQKAELNLRLGNLYMEEYHFLLAKAQSNNTTPPDTSEAMASLEKARTIFNDLLQKYPNHPRKDEMMYFLALINQDRGKTEEAISYLQKLIQQNPSSRFISEATIQVADYFFEKNKFHDAELLYDKVIALNNQKSLPYATYKKAWCAYNSGRFQQSLDLFKSIVSWESAENGSSLMRLKTEALRDIALPFVELHLADQAIAFYQAQGEPSNKTGLESLASLFLDKADYKNAIRLNEKLLSLDSNSPKNPTYDLALVSAIRSIGNTDRAIARLFSQLPNYVQGSTWYELNSGSPEVVKSAALEFEETARKYALEIHAEGQKTNNDALYNRARLLYEKYLEFFPTSNHAQTVKFYLAEILYKRGEYNSAADLYFAVYKSPTAGNLRLDAIRYALNALDREMNAQRKKAGLTEISKSNTTKLKNESDESTPTPLNGIETKFLQVAEDYISHFPKSSDTPEVQYQIAYLKYSHLQFPEAYKNFWGIMQNFSGNPISYSSAFLILDILNRRKEYPKLAQACKKFLETPALSKGEFKKEVATVLRHSELKRIQEIEATGDFKASAQAYVEYTKAYGSQDEALLEKAIYNASVNFYKAEDTQAALEIQEKFLRRFPKSSLRENMLLQVAKTYESLANFEKAAYYFELFANSYPSHAQSSSALRLASLYYWGAKNEEKAEQLMKTHLARYPKEASVVTADLLDLFESQGAINKQLSYYQEQRTKKGISPVDYLANTLKVAELLKQKNGTMPLSTMEEALKITQKFQSKLVKDAAGIEQMAKTLFWFSTQKEQLYYRIKLALPQRNLELNLKRKLALLKEMEREFSHIAKLGGGEWGLGAIYKTANAYHVLAQDVAQAPVPSELSGEQLEQYRTELKRQMIIPFNEKALGLVGQCLDKAQEFNLVSQWTPKCYSLGSELNQDRYPTLKTFYLPPVRVAVMGNSKTSKIPAGELVRQEFPFESVALFNNSMSGRMIASVSTSLPSLFDEGHGFGADTERSLPSPFTYQLLESQRREWVEKSLESNRSGKHSNYGYLYYMRLSNPQKAQPLILRAIQQDPNNAALHNLLGLCYLDLGLFNSAKITWLSLLARGVNTPEVQNNLGVLASLMGREKQAIAFFKASTSKEGAVEAWNNLGFIALKNRNGFQAKEYFQKAAAINSQDVASHVGLGIAQLQNREFDAAKDQLSEASTKFSTDPFAKLALTYLLLDVEKDQSGAMSFLEEYSQNQGNLENDANFRQVIQDVKKDKGRLGAKNSDLESLPALAN